MLCPKTWWSMGLEFGYSRFFLLRSFWLCAYLILKYGGECLLCVSSFFKATSILMLYNTQSKF